MLRYIFRIFRHKVEGVPEEEHEPVRPDDGPEHLLAVEVGRRGGRATTPSEAMRGRRGNRGVPEVPAAGERAQP